MKSSLAQQGWRAVGLALLSISISWGLPLSLGFSPLVGYGTVAVGTLLNILLSVNWFAQGDLFTAVLLVIVQFPVVVYNVSLLQRNPHALSIADVALPLLLGVVVALLGWERGT